VKLKSYKNIFQLLQTYIIDFIIIILIIFLVFQYNSEGHIKVTIIAQFLKGIELFDLYLRLIIIDF